jgi:hypothetical protein
MLLLSPAGGVRHRIPASSGAGVGDRVVGSGASGSGAICWQNKVPWENSLLKKVPDALFKHREVALNWRSV